MRKLIFLFSAVCFMACQAPAPKQYFESSPEIDIVKKGNQAYLDKDWTALRALYADTAKIADNTWGNDKYISPDQFIERISQGADNVTAINLSDDAIFSMVVTDKGEKYVLNWLNWSAKTKDGKDFSTPLHAVFRVEGGKVVFQAIMFNALPGYLASQPPKDSTTAK